jgi:lipoic acid synthetase
LNLAIFDRKALRNQPRLSAAAVAGGGTDQAVQIIFNPPFGRSSGSAVQTACPQIPQKHPDWLIRPAPNMVGIQRMEALLDRLQLATVCQSANCPNLGECFNRSTATFMILGTHCTRNCRFCAVDRGRPQAVDQDEPERIARAVAALKLNYVVVTSVTRDDLTDGGAEQFCRTIECVRQQCPQTGIEVLIPDFKGAIQALQSVCDARPDILNHNVETVARLYPAVRPRASYLRSLGILEVAARQGVPVKSGLMLGLGETSGEIAQTLRDIKRVGCRCVTLGQYLAPSKHHHPVDRYVSPEEFNQWAAFARQTGFTRIAAGPLVRSSYRADEIYKKRIISERVGDSIRGQGVKGSSQMLKN